jgi:diguanylate cyclase (GGDEF)-like protein/PAS domain S-box-containing protein
MDKTSTKDLLARICELEAEIKTLKTTSREEIDSSLTKYRRVINSTSEGFLQLDLDFRVVDYNSAMPELLGIHGGDLLGHPVDTLYKKSSVFIHFASKDHLSFDAVFPTRSGNELALLFKRSILRDNEGHPVGYLVFLTDLTELKKAREKLQQAESRYRNIYKNAVQGMYQTTLDGRFLRINPAFAKIFGYEQTAPLLMHPSGARGLYKDPATRQQLLTELLRYRFITNFEAEMQDRDGKPVWVMINARLTDDSNGKPIIEGILIDNTKKRLAEDKLHRSRERFRYLANHDSLTGLFNTRYLYKELDRLISESLETNEPFSLVFLDMDNFKHVVDTYGHLHGSQALKEVAKTLKSGLTDPAFGVAYGGDEFVLVLPQTGKEAAFKLVQNIRRLMKNTVYLTKHGLEVHMSASFGVATYPDDASDRVELLALADEAMFHIKNRGKDAVGVTRRSK